ncbi:pyridoxal phosphate-dependent transferase [Xylariomycetidae sp. FL0641]|nr:pyridoxal phosphate-dependent transferase [Xylariomycetidae sp. FL0641]
MVHIAPFAVEPWMDAYETTTPGILNISETCSSSISLTEFAELDSSPSSAGGGLLQTLATPRLTSGADDVLVTQGAIHGEPAGVLRAALCSGPATTSSAPRAGEPGGAAASQLRLRAEDGYLRAGRGGCCGRPNPRIHGRAQRPEQPRRIRDPGLGAPYRSIVSLARDLVVLRGDEVGGGTGAAAPPSALDLGYARGHHRDGRQQPVEGSWSLAAGRDPGRVGGRGRARRRGGGGVRAVGGAVRPNLVLARANPAPVAGFTTKVMLVPGGHCFGVGDEHKGFVRFGYVCETEVLREALKRLAAYVAEHLQ